MLPRDVDRLYSIRSVRKLACARRRTGQPCSTTSEIDSAPLSDTHDPPLFGGVCEVLGDRSLKRDQW